jgi:hypothetical protein
LKSVLDIPRISKQERQELDRIPCWLNSPRTVVLEMTLLSAALEASWLFGLVP